MLKIEFEYADEMSGWEWRKQSCVCESVQKCIDWYGLGKDCKYRIISATPV